MSREILFRGKRIDNGEWVEGYFIQDTTFYGRPDPHSYIVNYEHPSGCFGRDIYIEVDPETVCQYTGLTEKNGKKIFEGDIVKTHYANAKKNIFIETVVYHGGRFCAFQDKDGCKSWAGLFDGVPHLSIDKSVYMDEIEVIGNIFDNHELNL